MPRAFLTSLVLAPVLTFGLGLADASAPAGSVGSAPEATDAPPVTVNPFLPDDRGVSECVSALPKPGCGSKERGGWHQGLVFIALVLGLSVIGWRIIAGARRNARAAPPVSDHRTPVATTAPGDHDGDRAP